MYAARGAALIAAAGVVWGCAGRHDTAGGPSKPQLSATVAGIASAAPSAGSPRPACAAPLGLDVVPATDSRSGSTVVMARVHGRLLAYAADDEENLVRILDVDAASEVGAQPVPGRPARMLMLPGGRLAVTLRDQAKVALYTPAPIGEDRLDPLCSLDTPDEPVDLALAPDHKALFVVSDWGHTLSSFDTETGKPGFNLDLPRSARAVLAAADGRHAYVAHAAGGAMTAVDLTAGEPAVLRVSLGGSSTDRPDLSGARFFPTPVAVDFDDFVEMPRHPIRRAPRRITKQAFRPDAGDIGGDPARKRAACQGFALAEIAGPAARVFSPIVEVTTGDLEAPSTGYGPGASATPELPAIAVLDESSGKPVAASLHAEELTREQVRANPPCLLPRAAAASKGSLFVACMGTDTVVEYDATGEVPKERRRWAVPLGPTGLVVHGNHVVVWSQLARGAAILALDANDPKAPVIVAVRKRARSAAEEELALGRALFHRTFDSNISRDGRACASCHPDGRDDGLVWSTPGGPRQTPMLAGRLPGTAPYGWDGAGADVDKHLSHTFARLEGEGLAGHDREALVRYISTLPGPSVHAPPDGDALAKGRDVFFAAGCGSCHSTEGGYADGKSHDVGSRAGADGVASFDTPSLQFVGGTAPYFHDGRYATLHDLLASKDGPMGAASGRSPEDLAALEAFVRSL